MANDVSLQIDNALIVIVNVTERSGNLNKELKHQIQETVSHLRKLVVTLECELLEETETNRKMTIEFKQLKDALLEKKKPTTPLKQVATYSNCNTVLTSCGTAASAPPCCITNNLYSEVLGGRHEERHKVTVKPKSNQSTEEIKQLLKSRTDTINMKIGIRTLKSLKNEHALIGADSKVQLELLNCQIHDNWGSTGNKHPETKESQTNNI